jgi:uncharacterized protein YceK
MEQIKFIRLIVICFFLENCYTISSIPHWPREQSCIVYGGVRACHVYRSHPGDAFTWAFYLPGNLVMDTVLLPITIPVAFLNVFIHSVLFAKFEIEPKTKWKGRWSKNMGKMSWDEAKSECSDLNMRLPEPIDFKKSLIANEIPFNHIKEKEEYWTSKNTYSHWNTPIAYSFYLYAQDHHGTDRHNDIDRDSHFVRCLPLRSEEEKREEEMRKYLDSNRWSDYQGEMIPAKGFSHCKTLKMRLPKYEELDYAEIDGYTKKWRAPEIAYYLTMEKYDPSKIQKDGWASTKNKTSNVRCIRD